jgi:hypothetical protein
MSSLTNTVQELENMWKSIPVRFTKKDKIVKSITEHPLVRTAAFDKQKRLTAVTVPLYVKREDWSRKRVIGEFHIRVDFKKPYDYGGVQILNVTKHVGDFDTVAVKRTTPCWGNLEDDIYQEFQQRDYYELIADSIDFIQSPNDSEAYIRWDDFFSELTYRPKGYSFDRVDNGPSASESITFNRLRTAMEINADYINSYAITASSRWMTGRRITIEDSQQLMETEGAEGSISNRDLLYTQLINIGFTSAYAHRVANQLGGGSPISLSISLHPLDQAFFAVNFITHLTTTTFNFRAGDAFTQSFLDRYLASICSAGLLLTFGQNYQITIRPL